MNPGFASLPPEAARFRRRLLAAMLVVVALLTAAALVIARQAIASEARAGFEREFQAALATLQQVRELRHAALVERSRALALRSRIRAALEDGALDLLYPSARDELRDAVAVEPAGPGRTEPATTLRAHFYRFLDAGGRVLTPPPDDTACGPLPAEAEARLALARVPDHPDTGYIVIAAGDPALRELIATPILSSETGAPIAALVLGFPPVRLGHGDAAGPRFASGVWAEAHLDLPGLPPAERKSLRAALTADLANHQMPAPSAQFHFTAEGAPHLVFYQRVNPGSLLPAGYEVCVFPLAAMHARQRRVTWQILGAGVILVLAGFAASGVLAGRFTRPVAALAHDSREQRAQRERAEAELETTNAELERVARFSADASHQLKTPVTVMRAGLEELLARGALPPAEVEEVAALIHQTYRLSTVIEDLLLLSRLDAGQLRINFATVDLDHLIAASLDDLSALPDDFALTIEADCQPPLRVAGERRYIALILQNLLENARKYNRAGGRIQLAARTVDGAVRVTIGNTTRRPIPPAAQAHIFERFHRAEIGENIPGYGIGLNLARELARLHDGDLRLVRSDDDWTEFELRLRASAIA